MWLESIESGNWYQLLRFHMNRWLVDFFASHVLSGCSGLRVAEIACGSGFGAHLLAQRPEVSISIAADLNLEDFHQARIANFSASFVQMDMFKPSICMESLDFVWNSSSIEELDDPKQAIGSMASLLKFGGRIFVGVPKKYGIVGLLHFFPINRFRTWLGKPYRPNEITSLVEKNGLKVEKVTTYLYGIFVGVLAVKTIKGESFSTAP
jgi:SAM-dependent methyltransferase